MGSRVRVFWTGERRWFKGVCGKSTVEGGRTIHKVTYDDGDVKWHDLTEEIWLSEPDAKSKTSKTSKASTSAPAAAASSAGKKRPAAAAVADEVEDSRGNGSGNGSGNGKARASTSSPPPKAKLKPAKKTSSSGAPAALPAWAQGCGRAPPAAAALADGVRVPPLPPSLVSLSEADVEVFPCGVIKVKNAMPVEARQRLWDTVMCAGFDYREIAQGKKDNQGANMWYTKAAGAPDILLHYNYYEPPNAEQPPPMAVLCAADSVFREVSKLSVAQSILEPKSNEEDDNEDVASEGTTSAATVPGEGAPSTSADRSSGEAAAGGNASSGEGASSGGAAKRSKPEKEVWVDEAAADLATLAENVAKRKEEEERRLLWPRHPNFRSVLAIGYRPTDTFRWHTDLAGEEGWVCSLSVGATSYFEYLPTAAPSALRRARARAEGSEVVRVEIASGDAVLFNGGLLAHRVASVAPDSCDGAMGSAEQMAPYVRLNCQVRYYGSGEGYGLHELLARGFDYVE